MANILILNEYVREDHFMLVEGKPINRYLNTDMGKKLKSKLSGIGLTKKDYDVDYAYDLVPKPKKVDDRTGKIYSYVEPTMAERKEPQKRLIKKLLQNKPKMIVITGNIGCKMFLNESAITRLRGIPKKVTIKDEDTLEEFETWVLPIFSMEYITTKPNMEDMVDVDLLHLVKFVKHDYDGHSAFDPVKANYEFVNKINRVRDIFKSVFENKPVSSWDLETNTLQPAMLGAKVLVFSLSWKEAQGVTIPLEHKDHTWKKEELDEIYLLIEEYVASKELIKVGHHIQFDIRFLMSVKGFTEFNNHRDTMIMYYLSTNQDKAVSFRLTDLSFVFTDMGGYDKELEDYKKQYFKDFNASEKIRIDMELERINAVFKKEKEDLDAKYKEEMKVYKEQKKQLKKEKKSILHLTPPIKEKPKTVKVKKSDIKPNKLKNEIDGGDFNYEWIPLEIMHPYASGDTDCCLRIYNSLIKKIEGNEDMMFQATVFYPQLTVALARLESNGIGTNQDYMEDINREYSKEEERLIEEMRKIPEVKELEEQHKALYLAGLEEFKKPKEERDQAIVDLRKYKDKLEFNPNSSEQKSKVLYQIMGLKLPFDKESIKESAMDAGKTEAQIIWSDYKADTKALDYIKQHYPEAKELAELLSQHSKVKTLKNNFTSKLLNFISNKDQRVHGSFKSTGTETTRLSSNNPKDILGL